jgi:hypothetical protein
MRFARLPPPLFVVALALAACGKSQGSAGAQPVASSSALASASASASSSGAPSKLGSFIADLDGRTFALGGIKIVPYANYLHVILSSGPLDCDKTPRDEDVVVELDLAPGPGGKFFAGQKQGVPVRWSSAKLPFKWAQATPYQTIATVEPFALAAGEKLKGTLEFSLSYTDPREDAGAHAYKASGGFEGVVCPDFNGFKTLKGSPEDAGAAPFAGAFGSQKFAYKKALAIVFKDLQSREEYLESIELYDDDNVTCANRYDKKNNARYVSVTSIGGAGAAHALGGTQAADASFSTPGHEKPGEKKGGGKWHFFARRRAWVRLDKYAFKGGEVLTGSVFAETTPDTKADEAGLMQGKFEAKICNLTW